MDVQTFIEDACHFQSGVGEKDLSADQTGQGGPQFKPETMQFEEGPADGSGGNNRASAERSWIE